MIIVLNSKQRVIITGSSGFIGSSLYSYLKNKNMDCLGISRSKSIYTDIVIDNYEEVISMNDGNSLLINLAGNNINVSEEETKFVNSLSESFKN